MEKASLSIARDQKMKMLRQLGKQVAIIDLAEIPRALPEPSISFLCSQQVFRYSLCKWDERGSTTSLSLSGRPLHAWLRKADAHSLWIVTANLFKTCLCARSHTEPQPAHTHLLQW